MPRALSPHRIWLYLILAAAMLASPLLQYTDSGERLSAIAAGAAVLTLIAYGEIFASVRRGTRILRAMHGQRDLMFLADVSPLSARRDIRRDLWQNGGWVALGALWVGRFALAFALAQYLQLFHLFLPHRLLTQPFNALFETVNYISYNGFYQPNGTWQTVWYQPVWWQRLSAAALLLIVLLAEVRFMQAIGMAVFLRPRHMQRWAVPSGLAIRLVICGFALLAVLGVSIIPHEPRYDYTRRMDLLCMDQERHIATRYLTNSTLSAEDCSKWFVRYQTKRALETSQLGIAVFLDGSVLLSATIMRTTMTQTYTGTWLDYQLDVTYTTHLNGYPPEYSYQWKERVSPLLLILRMVASALMALLLMTLTNCFINWLIARRYHAVPS